MWWWSGLPHPSRNLNRLRSGSRNTICLTRRVKHGTRVPWFTLDSCWKGREAKPSAECDPTISKSHYCTLFQRKIPTSKNNLLHTGALVKHFSDVRTGVPGDTLLSSNALWQVIYSRKANLPNPHCFIWSDSLQLRSANSHLPLECKAVSEKA